MLLLGVTGGGKDRLATVSFHLRLGGRSPEVVFSKKALLKCFFSYLGRGLSASPQTEQRRQRPAKNHVAT